MKHDIDIEFEIGDVVWHKNLATNEAVQTKVKSYRAIIVSDGSKCVIYDTEDGFPIMNIIGEHKSSDLFATKEECDSYPPYEPKQVF